MEFVSLSEKRILLILVTTDGDVQNRILFTERPYSDSELVVATNYLNQHFVGHDFEQLCNRVREDLRKLRGDLQNLMAAALAAGDEALRQTDGQYVISGERNLLEVEELSSNMKRLRELFDPSSSARRSCNCLISRTGPTVFRSTLVANRAWRRSTNAAWSPRPTKSTARSSVPSGSSGRHAWLTSA